MTLIEHTRPKMIISEVGKMIRSVDDIYIAEHYDEEGNLIPEKFPYYSTTIFVPNDFTEEQMNELYVEESITEGGE